MSNQPPKKAPSLKEVSISIAAEGAKVLFPGHAFPPGKFSSDPTMIFYDISLEVERTYIFPGGHEYVIENPLAVAVKKPPIAFGGGAHRVVDKLGNPHYIPAGWIAITWSKANSDELPFDF